MSSSATGLDRPIFHEEQRFRQLWLWMVVIAICLAALAAVTSLIPALLHPAPAGVGIGREAILAAVSVGAGIVVSLAIVWLLYAARLITEVRRDGVYFRFLPFHRSFRRCGWEEIESFEARTYRPILEYGGWGLRGSFRNGKAYNVSGNRGVQLALKNGKKTLFGSQRPEEFVAAIRTAKGERMRMS